MLGPFPILRLSSLPSSLSRSLDSLDLPQGPFRQDPLAKHVRDLLDRNTLSCPAMGSRRHASVGALSQFLGHFVFRIHQEGLLQHGEGDAGGARAGVG